MGPAGPPAEDEGVKIEASSTGPLFGGGGKARSRALSFLTCSFLPSRTELFSTPNCALPVVISIPSFRRESPQPSAPRCLLSCFPAHLSYYSWCYAATDRANRKPSCNPRPPSRASSTVIPKGHPASPLPWSSPRSRPFPPLCFPNQMSDILRHPIGDNYPRPATFRSTRSPSCAPGPRASFP